MYETIQCQSCVEFITLSDYNQLDVQKKWFSYAHKQNMPIFKGKTPEQTGSGMRIYICDAMLNKTRCIAYTSQAILHELIHKILLTRDIGNYSVGYYESQNFAFNEPDKVIIHADCMANFIDSFNNHDLSKRFLPLDSLNCDDVINEYDSRHKKYFAKA